MVARGEGAPNILSVACIAYVQSALRPASVTLTRQIGSDKLISFTGDLGDLRIPGDSLFDILHAGPPPSFRFGGIRGSSSPLQPRVHLNLERLKVYI